VTAEVHVGDGRVPYRVAAEAHRDVIRRANAMRPRIGGRRRAVLEAVLVQTVSYSKLEDWTSVRQLARIVFAGIEPDGRDRGWVSDELLALHTAGLIAVEANGKRGCAARVKVSVRDTSAAESTSNDEKIGHGFLGHSLGALASMDGAHGNNGRGLEPNGRDLTTGMAAGSTAHREVLGINYREINPRRAEARVDYCADCANEDHDVPAPCPIPGHRETFSRAVAS